MELCDKSGDGECGLVGSVLVEGVCERGGALLDVKQEDKVSVNNWDKLAKVDSVATGVEVGSMVVVKISEVGL